MAKKFVVLMIIFLFSPLGAFADSCHFQKRIENSLSLYEGGLRDEVFNIHGYVSRNYSSHQFFTLGDFTYLKRVSAGGVLVEQASVTVGNGRPIQEKIAYVNNTPYAVDVFLMEYYLSASTSYQTEVGGTLILIGNPFTCEVKLHGSIWDYQGAAGGPYRYIKK